MTTTIDVSGLPEPVVRDIQRLVDTLRRDLTPNASGTEISAGEWVRRWRTWTMSQPRLDTLADDSRESIYEGRGE